MESLYTGDCSVSSAGAGLLQNMRGLGESYGFSEGSSSVQSSAGPRMQLQQSCAPHPHATFYPEDLHPGYLHHHSSIVPAPQFQSPFPYNLYKPPDDQQPVPKLPTPSEMAIILAPSGHLPLPIPSEAQAAYPALEEELAVSREKKHACSMCHKRFDRPSTLRKHLLVHTGEKAFQCETCGRRFGVASNLNRHVRRCILKPVNVHAAIQGSSSATAAVPSTPPDPATEPSETSAETTTEANPEASEAPATTPRRARKSTSTNTDATTSNSSSTHTLVYVAFPNPPPPPPPNQPKRRRRAPSPSRWIPPSLLGFFLHPPQKQKSTPVPLPPVSPTQPQAPVPPSLAGFYLLPETVPSGVLTPRTQNSPPVYAPGSDYPTSTYSPHINITIPQSCYPNHSHSPTTNQQNQNQPPSDALLSLSASLSALTLYEERDSYDDTVGMAPYHPREWVQRPRLPGPGILSAVFPRQSGGDLDFGEGGNGSMGMFSVFGYRSSNSGHDGYGDDGSGGGRGRSRKKGVGGERRVSGAGGGDEYQLVVQDYRNPNADTVNTPAVTTTARATNYSGDLGTGVGVGVGVLDLDTQVPRSTPSPQELSPTYSSYPSELGFVQALNGHDQSQGQSQEQGQGRQGWTSPPHNSGNYNHHHQHHDGGGHGGVGGVGGSGGSILVH